MSTIPFLALSLALSGPRGSGRTWRTLRFAPKDATILVRDAELRRHIEEQARDLDRGDLKFVVVTEHEHIAGLKGPFVPEHDTVEHWLVEAARLQGRVRQLEAKIAELQQATKENV